MRKSMMMLLASTALAATLPLSVLAAPEGSGRVTTDGLNAAVLSLGGQ